MFNFWALLIAGIIFCLVGIWFFVYCFVKGDFDFDAYLFAIFIVILGFVFIWLSFTGFPACKNCGYHSNEMFCSKCGYEFDPKITCECGELYSVDSHPAYCPDCGFELESEVK